jgi:flavin-dependent thymidylate synthase
MMVTLIDYTGYGCFDPARRAANLLIFTKSTRLKMHLDLMEEIQNWSHQKVLEELKYMANTNPGSWEFIHFTFLIEGVSRAFTHQLVRTRTASYSQQSMRVVNMEEWTYEIGPSITSNEIRSDVYISTMKMIDAAYKTLIDNGANTEDARGVLPTNIHTNIMITINMRNFINMARKRSSIRVMNEHEKVIDAMVIEIERVYPWFYIFYKNDEVQAMRDLQDMINFNDKLSIGEKNDMFKKIDLLKKEL